MRPFKHLSVKSKMTVIILLTCGLALLLASAGFVVYERIAFRSNLIEEMTTLAELTSKNCSATLSFDDADAAKRILANLSGEKSFMAACIYKDGTNWARYSRTLDQGEFPPGPS